MKQRIPWSGTIIRREDGWHTDVESGWMIHILNDKDQAVASGAIGGDYLNVRGQAASDTFSDMPDTLKTACVGRDVRDLVGLSGLIPPRRIASWTTYSICVEFHFHDAWSENWFLLNRNVRRWG